MTMGEGPPAIAGSCVDSSVERKEKKTAKGAQARDNRSTR